MPTTKLSDVEAKELLPGFMGKMVHTDTMTWAFWEVKKGSELPLHHHVHEQVTHLLEGEFEMIVDGKKQVCKPGEVLVLPSNVPHQGKALSDCKILDVFSPAREEYK